MSRARTTRSGRRATASETGRAKSRELLEPLADPDRAAKMSAYLKNQFEFLGVMAGPRNEATREYIKDTSEGSVEDVWLAVEECWAQPEREFQLLGADLLRKNAGRMSVQDLDRVRRLIERKSWWDTVDVLAPHVAGVIVRQHEQGAVMDEWVDADDFWVARAAILHQLFYKSGTDQERLFDYCRRRAADKEFFIRKALGWALRQYAKSNPSAVENFVTAHADELSGLTKREALKHF